MRMRVHAERMCAEVRLAAHPTMFVCSCFSGKFEISPSLELGKRLSVWAHTHYSPSFPPAPSPLTPPLAHHSTFLSLFGQCRGTIE